MMLRNLTRRTSRGTRQRGGARKLDRHVVGMATLAVLWTLLFVGAPRAAYGAEATALPARPLAEVLATKNHEPFPLVAANEAGEVRFALSEFADGKAHFYTWMVSALPVEFFVIWTPDNVIRTALNACDVCYRAKLGYHQDGQFMVCNNCGNRFPVEKIDTVNGGCNPTPLAARIDGSELVITTASLAAGLAYFP